MARTRSGRASTARACARRHDQPRLPAHALGTRSGAELAQMVVHMAVAEALPLPIRQAAEDGVFTPGEAGLFAAEAMDDSDQLVSVLLEINRWRATDFLIPLRPRGKTVRPRPRQPQRDPSQRQSRDPLRGEACFFLAQAGTEDVGEMADHLMRRHGAPSALTAGRYPLQAPKYFIAITGVGKSFHLPQGDSTGEVPARTQLTEEEFHAVIVVSGDGVHPAAST
jgi:hypothetical protein